MGDAAYASTTREKSGGKPVTAADVLRLIPRRWPDAADPEPSPSPEAGDELADRIAMSASMLIGIEFWRW